IRTAKTKRGDVVGLRRFDCAALRRGRDRYFLFFALAGERGRATGARYDAKKERASTLGQLHFEAEIADLDDIAFRDARTLDRLSVDVCAGDASLVADRKAGVVFFDDGVIQGHRRILRPQLRTRSSSDAQRRRIDLVQ